MPEAAFRILPRYNYYFHMKWESSFGITLANNATEKEAIEFVLRYDPRFVNPDKESRRHIMDELEIDKKYSKAFDLVYLPNRTRHEDSAQISDFSTITLVELKTTKKRLPNNPMGFFFGATENEFDLARKFADRYKFCFVSLHPETKSIALLSLDELNRIIRTKRTQYQINIQSN